MKRILTLSVLALCLAATDSHAGPIRNLIERVRERRAERQAVPCQTCQPAPAYRYVQPSYEVAQHYPTTAQPAFVNPFARTCTGPNCNK